MKKRKTLFLAIFLSLLLPSCKAEQALSTATTNSIPSESPLPTRTDIPRQTQTLTLLPSLTPIPPTPEFEEDLIYDPTAQTLNNSEGAVVFQLTEGADGKREWEQVMSELSMMVQEWRTADAERRAELSVQMAERINGSDAEVKVVVGGEELKFVANFWGRENPFWDEHGANPNDFPTWVDKGQWLPEDKIDPAYENDVLHDFEIARAAKTENGQHYMKNPDTGEWELVDTKIEIPGRGEVDIIQLASEIQTDPHSFMDYLYEHVVTKAGAREVDEEKYSGSRGPMIAFPAVVLRSFDAELYPAFGVYQELSTLASPVTEIESVGMSAKADDHIQIAFPLVKDGELVLWAVGHQGINDHNSFVVRGGGNVRHERVLGTASSQTFGAESGEVGILMFNLDPEHDAEEFLQSQPGVASNSNLVDILITLPSEDRLDDAIDQYSSHFLSVIWAPGAVINR